MSCFYDVLDNDFNIGKVMGILMQLVRVVNCFVVHKKVRKCGGFIVVFVLEVFVMVH